MHSGIYIHIPFCESKCGYCDFFSITNLDQVNKFLSGLENEIKIYADEFGGKELFDTIYIGGGTPSVLSAKQISHLIELIHEKYTITNDAEITIEINPGTVNQLKLADFKNAGINRLSIGIQSFNDNELQFLGRIHNSKQSIESVHYAREAGFDNISIDLIYALPNQTLATWETSMRKAIELNPEHISAYNLTIEKGTPFYDLKQKGNLKPLSESIEKEFFNFTNSVLSQAGYNRYEISSFSRGEYNISKHNGKYWQHNYYLGFGSSAHSFWDKQRWGNYKSVEKYVSDLREDKKPIDFSEILKTKDLEFEHIFLSLRTYRGLNLKEFQFRFTYDFVVKYKSIFSQFIENDYAKIDESYFRLTKEGMALYNEILPLFIED